MFKFLQLTPAAVRVRSLRDAELDLIAATRQAEYYTSMSRMLRDRVAVLKAEVNADNKALEVAARPVVPPRPAAVYDFSDKKGAQ